MSREAMKHTPGPWRIDPIKAHANGNRRIMAEQCTTVAVVPEHLAADARLIAAAPDLLEALKDLLDEAEWLRREYSHDRERDGWDALEEDPCFTVARAAIAKATGGEA